MPYPGSTHIIVLLLHMQFSVKKVRAEVHSNDTCASYMTLQSAPLQQAIAGKYSRIAGKGGDASMRLLQHMQERKNKAIAFPL